MEDSDKKKIVRIQKAFLEKVMPTEFTQEAKKHLSDYVDFRAELSSESDRGCALLAGSHLDYLLEKALKVKLIGSNNFKKKLFDFNGPLGTFSSKIIMAFSLGLISKDKLDDFQIIRKIRNLYGHSPKKISFEEETIASLCNNLKLTLDSNKTARSKFITSVTFISGRLNTLYHKGESFEEIDESDVEEIKKSVNQFIRKAAPYIENKLEEE